MRRSPKRTITEHKEGKTEGEDDSKGTDKIPMSLGAGADVK